jgi:hypothetical protein
MAMASSSGKRAATMAPAPHDQVDRHVKRKTCDLDFDTLECPVCTHLLSPPVFQVLLLLLCVQFSLACFRVRNGEVTFSVSHILSLYFRISNRKPS